MDSPPYFSTIEGTVLISDIDNGQALLRIEHPEAQRRMDITLLERMGLAQEGQKFKMDIFDRPDGTTCSRMYNAAEPSQGVTLPQNPVLFQKREYFIDGIEGEYMFLIPRNGKDHAEITVSAKTIFLTIPEPYTSAFVTREQYIEDDNTVWTKYVHNKEEEIKDREKLREYLNSPEVIKLNDDLMRQAQHPPTTQEKK